MKTILETERLLLREFTEADAAFLLELLNSPGWLKFIGNRNLKNTADAEQYSKDVLQKSYGVNGFGLYAICLKTDQKPIGMCGLVKRDYLKMPDIGYALLPKFEGQGYAFEAATAVLDYTKNQLNFQEIAAITTAKNNASRKLLEKLGLKFIKNIKPDKEELMLFQAKL